MKESAWRVMAASILGPKAFQNEDPHVVDTTNILRMLMQLRTRAQATVDATNTLIDAVPIGGWKKE